MSPSLIILTAFAAVGVINVACEAIFTDRDKVDDLPYLKPLIGYKPCFDDNCETNGPSQAKTNGTKITYEPQNPPAPIPGKTEDPRVHCIFLRPNALTAFKELEAVYPDISAIKYSVLEDIIHYMRSFAKMAFGNCEPDMKLLDLVIVAANSLKEEYRLQGVQDCEYENYEENVEIHGSSDYESGMPCDSASSNCYDHTMKPKMGTPVPHMPTEKPYEHNPTEQTEKPYVPSLTTKPYHPSTEQPYVPSSEHSSAEKHVKKSCPDVMTTEQPCQSGSVTDEYSDSVEVIVEHKEHGIPYVGSLRGIPGIHYPNYTDIPITTFTCADKKYIPGFYADLDTGCQVFHVCYEHRRESFLCPLGTTFNQPILACDYWYSSNCSLASSYYDVNGKSVLEEGKIDEEVEELLTSIAEDDKYQETTGTQTADSDLEKITPFFPVKAVVIDVEPRVKPTVSDVEEVAAEIVDNMATTATKVISKAKVIVQSIPEPVAPEPVLKPVVPKFLKGKKTLRFEDLLKKSVVPLAKAKLAAIPVSVVTALKTAVPVAGLAAKKASIPVAAAKAKLVTKVAAIPAVKAAVAAPIVAKAKMAAIPAVKAAVAAPIVVKAKMAAIPAVKAAVAAPIVAKAKMAAIPAVKAAVAAPVLAKAKIAVTAPIVAKGTLAVPAVKMGAAKVVAKSSIPALKTKMIASAIPLAKTKFVPLMKVSAGAPLLKAKMLALPLAKSKLAGPIPIAKVKLAKAAAISPLTKKALALGYMKLLKAKKVALMG